MNPASLPKNDVVVDQFFEPLLHWGWTAGRQHQKEEIRPFLERMAHHLNGYSAARSQEESNGTFSIEMHKTPEELLGPSQNELKLNVTPESRIWSRIAFPGRMLIGSNVLFISKAIMPEAVANTIRNRLDQNETIMMKDIIEIDIPLPNAQIIREENLSTTYYRYKLLSNDNTWRNTVGRILAKIDKQKEQT